MGEGNFDSAAPSPSATTTVPHRVVDDVPAKDAPKVKILLNLCEPCTRKEYGKRLRDAARDLGVNVRTIQRLVKKWEAEGVAGVITGVRADKGTHRVDKKYGFPWKKFIIDTYKWGNKGSKRMTPAQVVERMEAHATKVLKLPRTQERYKRAYPSHQTVYNVLTPYEERLKNPKSPRQRGWRGQRLEIRTSDGEIIAITFSNQCWQVDHAVVNVLVRDADGTLKRPYLTIVVDTYSRCIMGFELSFRPRSSQIVALALRHAILTKQYGPEYGLHCTWGAYGISPYIYLYTDKGSDFQSAHIADQVALALGLNTALREKPSDGGIVERPFGSFDDQFFSSLPGYTGKGLTHRSEQAEKDACITLLDLRRRFVRFVVDNYNQRPDARTGDQTRYQRWEAGLIETPTLPAERELDICLMKVARRVVYKGGYVQFDNVSYKGELLAGYAGEFVSLRYNPDEPATMLVYKYNEAKKVDDYITKASAFDLVDLESDLVSGEALKASVATLRKRGEAIDNSSIAAEILARDEWVREEERARDGGRRGGVRRKAAALVDPIRANLADGLVNTEDDPRLEVSDDHVSSIDATAQQAAGHREVRVWDYDAGFDAEDEL
ncbi:MAG: Mu transposase C-terminal domain-containing protein [Chloroflexota bacterium]|nr:Mu transposase C-terminal domain-containing protein [Chloroflexota bacterium]